MYRPLILAYVLSTLTAATIAAPAAAPPAGGVVVHEWGTFTAIAGSDGRAVEWLPLAGRSDLPSFVHLLRVNLKPSLPGTVRMETPVIYFYAPRETTATVRVRFKNGVVTEWFPRAAVTPAVVRGNELARPGFQGTIEWTNIRVMPRGVHDFPRDDRPSHYYAARHTDASPIARGTQREKFLFYRGVGAFVPPVAARVLSDGDIEVTTLDAVPLGPLVLFDKRADRVRYELRHIDSTRTTFSPDLPVGDLGALFAQLHGVLVESGLYPAEAQAMIDTWKDSWFEEGTRLFYVVPRARIDEILPLDIAPAPAEVARVFVGRVELITSATLEDVRQALARNDESTLQQYGRFLHHISTRLH